MIRRVKGPDGIVEYNLVKTHRHDIAMKVLADGEIRVFAPAYVPLREADGAVTAHISELLDMRKQLLHAVEKNRLSHPVAPGSRICVEGEAYSLVIESASREGCEIADGRFVLRSRAPEDEEHVRAQLRHILSKLALERIAERLAYYAPRLNVRYGRVTVREQRTRWGSCSSKDNLNFNWKLIMAPPDVLDYVVIHELCHLIEFNHSERFWRLVAREMPAYTSCVKWLKQHGKELGVG